MERADICFWTTFVDSEKHLTANFQLVDSGKLFPSTANNSGYTTAVNYPNGEVEVLICNEICPKCFFLESGSVIFFKERRSCVARDDLSKYKGNTTWLKNTQMFNIASVCQFTPYSKYFSNHPQHVLK